MLKRVILTIWMALVAEGVASQTFDEVMAEGLKALDGMMTVYGAGFPGSSTSIPLDDDDIMLGNNAASTRVLLYASIDCVHCHGFFAAAVRLHQSLTPELQADTQFIFRLIGATPSSASLSVVARCVANGDAERLSQMLDLFLDPNADPAWDVMDKLRIAGANEARIEECGTAERLQKVFEDQKALLSACDNIGCQRWIDDTTSEPRMRGSYSTPLFMIDEQAQASPHFQIEAYRLGREAFAVLGAEPTSAAAQPQ